MDRWEKARGEFRQPIPGLVPCTHCSIPPKSEPDLMQNMILGRSWYSDQLWICDDMMVITEMTTLRESSTGTPYTIRFGQVAPNACNVCYRALPRQYRHPNMSDRPSPRVLIFTNHCGILTFFVLRIPDHEDDDEMLNSFEGGFHFSRKDAIQFTYIG
ncbi:hypothetical protein SCHPADRAFT_515332 [Schizopora paradoxa]|uniref:Uncharacterized protein n=1 Tax=Schizopora paradoxa TaxID=27342 RepID=A0A0H2RF86_9AGAM|nr:hypothetical protein SCHPADRAFT_515332 [Schizopora paradoxa]